MTDPTCTAIERTFAWASTKERHLSAPLLRERDQYLVYLLQRGTSRRRVRTVAALLLQVIRVMALTELPHIKMEDVRRSDEEWTRNPWLSVGCRAGPSCAKPFADVAKGWFKFHGCFEAAKKPSRPFSSLVDRFEAHLLSSGYSLESIRGYCPRVGNFLSWLGGQAIPFSAVSVHHVDAFLNEKRSSGWRPRTIAAQCQSLRTFFAYAESMGWCQAGITRGIYSPPIPKYDQELKGAPWKEVRRLMRPSTTCRPAALRSAAVLTLCCTYALRSSEVKQLTLQDLNWSKETITIRRAKRGRVQQFPLTAEVGEAIIAYLRFGRAKTTCRAVFTTLTPPYRPMCSSSVWQVLHKTFLREGVTAPQFGAHAIRHAAATHLLRKGRPLTEIADFLGHSDLQSVSIYARHDTRALGQVADLSLRGLR